MITANRDANQTFRKYRKDAAIAAEELQYGEAIKQRVKNAKTEAEICRIMTTARQNTDRKKYAVISRKPVRP